MPTSLFNVGGSGVPAGIGGTLYSTTTPAGTDDDTAEKVLASYDLPANTFSGNADIVRVMTWGGFAANAHNRTVLLQVLGADDTFTTIAGMETALVSELDTASDEHLWQLSILMSGTVSEANFFGTSAVIPTDIAPPLLGAQGGLSIAIDGADAITLRVVGQNGITSAGTAIVDEDGTIPDDPGPYTVTVAHAADFLVDDGVTNGGTPMTKVVSGPATGEYSVDEGTGVYTFAAADKLDAVKISYHYGDGVTSENDVLCVGMLVEYLSSPS